MCINSNVPVRTVVECCEDMYSYLKNYSHYNRANLTIGKTTACATILVASMPKTDI
jgi:hypothetical protein